VPRLPAKEEEQRGKQHAHSVQGGHREGECQHEQRPISQRKVDPKQQPARG